MSTAPPSAHPQQHYRPLLPTMGPLAPLTPLGVRWPGPGRPAGLATLVSVGAAALVAALSIPLDRPGLGWLITAVAGTIALIVAAAVPARPLPGTPEPLVVRRTGKLGWDRFGWGTATVALLAVGTVRSSGWLFALCVLVAIVTGVLAVTGGHSMRAIVAGGLLAPFASLRALPWLRAGIARISTRGGRADGVRITATIAVSVALLLVFGALFASASDAFAEVLGALAPSIDVPTVFRWGFVFAVAVAALGGAAYLRAQPPAISVLDGTEGRKVGRFEWAVPLGLLVLLFAAFVAVQLTALFGGNSHVLRTHGLTYADYARGGFWQLSFVTGLTLAVLAGAARWAPRHKSADRMLLRAILGTLALLTLVIVASALLRIYLYTQTYGLTVLRLLVACCEGWFGLVLLMVLVAGIRIRAPWLPRAALAAGVLALLGLAVANPDAMIASTNIRLDRAIDWYYLESLSTDAVPSLMDIGDENRKVCVLDGIRSSLRGYGPDGWQSWNLDRERARELLSRVRVPDPGECR